MVRGEDARADVDAWLAGECLTAEGVHVSSRKATLTSAIFMLLEHNGATPKIDPTARIAPNAVLCGEVTIGAYRTGCSATVLSTWLVCPGGSNTGEDGVSATPMKTSILTAAEIAESM
jgi:hypothetical protein